ncbi:MAG: Ig-like domain-containing protein [Herbinix sp.]|nr:Ig-like domain-containing protein [Herbinix sp.]
MKKIKKLVVALLIVFAMIAPITLPVSGTYVVAEAATVSISKKTLKLDIGQTATLKISGTKSKVSWKSSDKEIATVTSKGVVLGYSAGNATITATVNKKKYTCKVTVNLPSNLFQSNADWQEIAIDKLSVVIPSACAYETTDDSDGYFVTTISFDDPGQKMIITANYTGEPALDYADVKAYYDETVSVDILEEYVEESGKTISNFQTYELASTQGTVYAYSYDMTGISTTATTVVYCVSIDNYTIEVASIDATNSSLYEIAEWALSSIMQ